MEFALNFSEMHNSKEEKNGPPFDSFCGGGSFTSMLILVLIQISFRLS